MSALIVAARPKGSPVLVVWSNRSLCKGLHAAGKRPGGLWQGQQTPLQSTEDPNCIAVAAVRTEAASIKGVFGGVESPWMAVLVRKKTGELRMCVDYREVNKQTSKDAYPLQLVDEVQDCLSGSTLLARKGVFGGVETATMLDSGSSISLIQKDVISHTHGVTRVRPIPQLQLKTASGEPLPVRDFVCTQVQLGQLKVKHGFVAVDRLVAPVILGVDFLQKNGLTLHGFHHKTSHSV